MNLIDMHEECSKWTTVLDTHVIALNYVTTYTDNGGAQIII